jgi:ammonia channel protein AmtB
MMRILSTIFMVLIVSIVVASFGWAQSAPMPGGPPPLTQPASTAASPQIDSGDTAWLLMSSALVLLMTAPGLALFYGGMVRQKNALGTIMQSFIIMAVISVQWVLWGYSIAFGPDIAGLIGGLDWIGLRGVGLDPGPYSDTVLGYDDSLHVVGVHGVGGTWGAIATGLFATKTINAAGADGLFYGNPGQLWNQVIGILAAAVLAFVATFIILKVLEAIMGLRVAEEEEVEGLDLSQHSEMAYSLGGSAVRDR